MFRTAWFCGHRSFSQEEEIRRFSFGLDPDTFTEVEVCEKTFSFKISTDIRPAQGWNNNSSGTGSSSASTAASDSVRQASSTFRRASLAVMSGCKSFQGCQPVLSFDFCFLDVRPVSFNHIVIVCSSRGFFACIVHFCTDSRARCIINLDTISLNVLS